MQHKKKDLHVVTDVRNEVVANNPLFLDELELLILFKIIGDFRIYIQLGLWFEKTKCKDLINSIFIDIKEAFDKAKIEIPLSHIHLYSGEASQILKMDFYEQTKLWVCHKFSFPR